MRKITGALKRYVFLPVLAIAACLLIHVDAGAATGKVYFSVEKFTIGQGYLIEPCEVTITDGEKVSQITERVLKEKGYSSDIPKSGIWYLKGIKNADSGKVMIPGCIQNEWGSSITSKSDKDLGEFDYSNSSGWLYYYNNESPKYTADSCVAHDGDAIRWRFTLFSGDLGSDRLALPDMDSLTKAMAIFNANKALCVEKGYQSAYNEALTFVTNMDAYYIDGSSSGHTQAEVEAKIKNLCAKLPTQAMINQWQAEKTAAEKAAAEKAAAEKAAAEKAAEQAKIKKYTPSAPKWKSLKSVKSRTATLTWKKNSKATGYMLYMSTKKSSGYKKIATVKSWKKITYTKNKLKKKKTYYFKLRAYKTAGGKKYYSSYSSVKKVKVK